MSFAFCNIHDGPCPNCDPKQEPVEQLEAPECVTFIIGDLHGTECALLYLNEHVPASKRTVKIRLTEDQRRALRLRKVGDDRGSPVLEVVFECFVDEGETRKP